MLTKIKGIIALSRWIEVYDFTLALTFITVLFAGGWAGTRLIAIITANFLAMIYAFMINDVEDAIEDAEDPKKKKRNPISNGSLTRQEGWLVANVTLILSLLIFAYIAYTIGNASVLIAGAASLLISFLYSWRKVRLKAIPIIDVLTHMYMLSGAIFVTSYLAYTPNLTTPGWIAFISMMFVSGYGQLDNEIRDFVVDKKTGIKTLATIIGRKQAIVLQLVLIGIALVGFAYLGTLIIDPLGFITKYIICVIVIFLLNCLTYFKSNTTNIKVWMYRSLVLASAATAGWLLLSGTKLIN